MNDAAPAAGTPTGSDRVRSTVTEKVEATRARLDRLSAAMPTTERAASRSDIGPLVAAFDRFGRHAGDGGAVTDDVATKLTRTVDRLDAAVVLVEQADGRAERVRQFGALRRQVAGTLRILVPLGRCVEPDSDPVRFRAAMFAAAESEFLMALCAEVDDGLDRLDQQVASQRDTDEVLRIETRQRLDDCETEIDGRLASAERRLQGLVEQATGLVAQLNELGERDVLATLVHAHRTEEKDERRAFRRWRIAGIVVAVLSLVPLVWLFVSLPEPTIVGWISHLGPASLLVGIGTYLLRQAAHHRAEALSMRDRRLGMDFAVRAVSTDLTAEQQTMLRDVLDRARTAPTSDIASASSSISIVSPEMIKTALPFLRTDEARPPDPPADAR